MCLEFTLPFASDSASDRQASVLPTDSELLPDKGKCILGSTANAAMSSLSSPTPAPPSLQPHLTNSLRSFASANVTFPSLPTFATRIPRITS